MHFRKGFNQHLYTQFWLAIRADWSALEIFRTVVLLAINSSSGREKELGAFREFLHSFEEVDGSNHIIFVVVQRHHDWLICIFFSCEVNNALNWCVFFFLLLENLFNKLQIKNVSFFDMDTCSLLRCQYFKKSIDNILLTIGIVINHYYFSFANG